MTVVENQEVAECGCFLNAWLWFNKFVKKLMFKVVDNAKSAKKLGKEDPRRIVHSLKVGFTITLVSLFYYFEPKFHYEGFGVSAMWAVLTVVVVFEFTVGKLAYPNLLSIFEKYGFNLDTLIIRLSLTQHSHIIYVSSFL